MPIELKEERLFFKNINAVKFLGTYFIIFFFSFYGWVANYGYPEFMLNPAQKLTPAGKYIENAIHNFPIVFDVFFLVAGFLTCIHLLEEKERNGKIDLLKFYVRKILGIWPLYFFIIIMGPILSHLVNEPVPGYKYYFLFLGNFEIIKHGFSSAATNHLWPICIAMQFFIFIPLLISFLPSKHIPGIFAVLVFSSILYRGAISGTENYWMNIYANTFSRIDVLFIGAMGGFYFFYKQSIFKDDYKLKYLFFLVFLFVYLNTDLMDWDSFFAATSKKYFFILILAFGIGNFVLSPDVFVNPVIRFLNYLGKLSYSAYIISPLVILFLIKTFNHYSAHNLAIYIVSIHLLVIGLSFISYKLIELPFLRLKQKKFSAFTQKGSSIESFPGFH